MTILRVTDIIKANGLVDDEWIDDYALARGAATHKATALDDAGTLDEASVHEDVAGCLESWRRFRQEAGVEIRAIEMEVRHEPMRYAGRLDRVIQLRGRHSEILIDLKRGAAFPWHPIQTAGYAMAYSHHFSTPTPQRASVYLQPDGRAAKFVSHNDRADFDEWKHLVAVAHFKERNRIYDFRPRDLAPFA